MYIEQASITGRDTLPTTAAGVVDTIKNVWYLAAGVVAVHSAFNLFRWHFTVKCHRWHLYQLNFILFFPSSGWVLIKLKLPHFHASYTCLVSIEHGAPVVQLILADSIRLCFVVFSYRSGQNFEAERLTTTHIMKEPVSTHERCR